jgi:hypothetical protein
MGDLFLRPPESRLESVPSTQSHRDVRAQELATPKLVPKVIRKKKGEWQVTGEEERDWTHIPPADKYCHGCKFFNSNPYWQMEPVCTNKKSGVGVPGFRDYFEGRDLPKNGKKPEWCPLRVEPDLKPRGWWCPQCQQTAHILAIGHNGRRRCSDCGSILVKNK